MTLFSNEILHGVPVHKTDENTATLTEAGASSVHPQGLQLGLFPPWYLRAAPEEPQSRNLKTTGLPPQFCLTSCLVTGPM